MNIDNSLLRRFSCIKVTGVETICVPRSARTGLPAAFLSLGLGYAPLCEDLVVFVVENGGHRVYLNADGSCDSVYVDDDTYHLREATVCKTVEALREVRVAARVLMLCDPWQMNIATRSKYFRQRIAG